MPLAGPVSYLPVADQFLDHWSRVESPLGNGAVVELGRGIDRQVVREVRQRLEAAQEEVTRARNAREEERRHLAELDAMIQRRVGQFNRQQDAGGEEGRTPDEVVRAWSALEQGGGRLVLEGWFSRLDFVTDLSARKLVASALSVSERSLSSARGKRDGAQEQLHAYLELYREWALECFPVGHPLRMSLPVLDLKPGRKPEAVSVSGRWQEGGAILAWEASEEPELDHYEVRAMAGNHYDQEDEVLLARVAADDPLRFTTDFALPEEGALAVFRVVVVLKSGHERGSQPVVVRRV